MVRVVRGAGPPQPLSVTDKDGDVVPVPAAQSTGDARVHDEVVATLLENIGDALERIQQQLGQINNGNNLGPGERFE